MDSATVPCRRAAAAELVDSSPVCLRFERPVKAAAAWERWGGSSE